eukprot:753931-Hanusia_phi.AAC.5
MNCLSFDSLSQIQARMNVDELSMTDAAIDISLLSATTSPASGRKRGIPEDENGAKRPCLSAMEPQGLHVRDSHGNVHVFRERPSLVDLLCACL